MEIPFIVKYDDGYWLHNLCGSNSYLPQSDFDNLCER